jgi:hypothetical protein
VLVCGKCSSSDKTTEIRAVLMSSSASVVTTGYGYEKSTLPLFSSLCEWRCSYVVELRFKWGILYRAIQKEWYTFICLLRNHWVWNQVICIKVLNLKVMNTQYGHPFSHSIHQVDNPIPAILPPPSLPLWLLPLWWSVALIPEDHVAYRRCPSRAPEKEVARGEVWRPRRPIA